MIRLTCARQSGKTERAQNSVVTSTKQSTAAESVQPTWLNQGLSQKLTPLVTKEHSKNGAKEMT